MNEKLKNRIRGLIGASKKGPITHFTGEPTSIPETPQPKPIFVSTKE